MTIGTVLEVKNTTYLKTTLHVSTSQAIIRRCLTRNFIIELSLFLLPCWNMDPDFKDVYSISYILIFLMYSINISNKIDNI
jgi:hypothetical protein